MEPILKTLAKEYSTRYRNLKNICFLFPNKRCGVFLKKYFAEEGLRSEQMPHIQTISEFAAMLAKTKEATRIVQIFTLYNAYKKILSRNGDKNQIEFDKFRGWGEIVLSDFNTVDFYMADPEVIFKNLKDFRSIATDYLTEEQKEVMREYFGIEDFSDSARFWKSFEEGKMTPLKEKFLTLWKVLYPLYKEFTSELGKDGLGSPGMIYRKAAERVKEDGNEKIPYDKVVAVSFNALTESEREIFKALKNTKAGFNDEPFIDFIWDATGPVLLSEDFSASRFVESNRRHFPMSEWMEEKLQEVEVTEYPEIEIISSPSVTAQAKIAGELLKEYVSPDKRSEIAEAQVALILPDESLLSNTLFSLPDNIGDINLTMGVSLRQSQVASFMILLRRVYSSMREYSDKKIIFVRDLKMLFSHPYSYWLFQPEHLEKTIELLDTKHKVSISVEELSETLPEAKDYLDFPSKKDRGGEIFGFLKKILDRLLQTVKEYKTHEESKEGGMDDATLQDYYQVDVYSQYLDALKDIMERYGIESSPASVMLTVDKLIAGEKMGFEGEPLSGLQIMGTLETRSLDFNHVIVLSMNEGIMPRKAYTSTFIPESLRKDYGLPPARYAEEIFGYYFYRLISRAKKVTLIYDGRVFSGMKGGESRYLLQLRQFVPKEKLHDTNWQFRLQNRESVTAEVKKTPEIRDLIMNYTPQGNERKNLSASALNTYRECQIRFFYRNLLNINSDAPSGEYMDAISIGNVLHDVMMDLYLPQNLHKKLLKDPVTLSAGHLQKLGEDKDLIKSLINKNIYKHFYGEPENTDKKLESGVADIIADQIAEMVKAIVKYDESLAPILLYGCEITQLIEVKMPSGKTVNFRFAIDRLDKVKGSDCYRIIDYKTGAKKLMAKDMAEMFKGGYKSEQIFQLFFYAWLLEKLGINKGDDIITEIYSVNSLMKGQRSLPAFDNIAVETYKPVAEEFEKYLSDMIETLFESPVFKEPESETTCTYCAFRYLCKKQ